MLNFPVVWSISGPIHFQGRQLLCLFVSLPVFLYLCGNLLMKNCGTCKTIGHNPLTSSCLKICRCKHLQIFIEMVRGCWCSCCCAHWARWPVICFQTCEKKSLIIIVRNHENDESLHGWIMSIIKNKQWTEFWAIFFSSQKFTGRPLHGSVPKCVSV